MELAVVVNHIGTAWLPCVFYVNFKLNSVFIILFAYICHPLPHLWTRRTKSQVVPSKFVLFFFLKHGFKMQATLNKHRLEGGCHTLKFSILGCAWKTLNKINDFNIYIYIFRLIKLC
jgi:hypothetical protein